MMQKEVGLGQKNLKQMIRRDAVDTCFGRIGVSAHIVVVVVRKDSEHI